MKDSDGYSTLETSSETGASDIVRYEARTGKRTVLISSEQFIPEGLSEPLYVADYTWSDDNSKLLLFTNTRRVWRYHTRGDYWVLDLQTGILQQLGKEVERTTMMFAKFSPDASRVAYVSKQNIYVEDLSTGEIRQLTFDGGDNIINGTFDWVYEEELGCRDGFRWSPDGEHIAYWQTDTEGTGIFYMINNVDSVYSVPIPLPYPKAGTTNSAVKVGVIPSTGGEARWFDIPGDPRNNYLARMDFIPGSDEVMIQQLNRKQNTNTVWVGNINTMELTNILTERDEAFLDIHDNIMWLDGEKYFTWSSERDGWLHLYKVSRDGRQMDLITKGDFDVISISRIDPAGGYVYYIASPDKPVDRYLYRSRLDGKGEAERVTPVDTPGQHSYQMSADAKWAIHSYQNVVTPPRIALVSLPDHRETRILVSNIEAKERYDRLGLRSKEFFRVDIGEVELDAWFIKPRDFDPSKKYPVIIYIYGEPAGATVQNSWGGGDLWHQYMAQHGYLYSALTQEGPGLQEEENGAKLFTGRLG
jgi:dipeptidyl-peptidase-4